MINHFLIGDRVEWDRRTHDGGTPAVWLGTVIEDSPGKLGFTHVRPDHPDPDSRDVAGTTCVRNELLRPAAPPGVREAIAGICAIGGDGSWWRALERADAIIALLVQTGYLAQPPCPPRPQRPVMMNPTIRPTHEEHP